MQETEKTRKEHFLRSPYRRYQVFPKMTGFASCANILPLTIISFSLNFFHAVFVLYITRENRTRRRPIVPNFSRQPPTVARNGIRNVDVDILAGNPNPENTQVE